VVGGGASVFGIGTMSSDPPGLAYDGLNGKLYWSDRAANEVKRANLDGSGQETVLSFSDPRWLALDPAAQLLYVSNSSQIQLFDLSSETLTPLLSFEGGPLALDV